MLLCKYRSKTSHLTCIPNCIKNTAMKEGKLTDVLGSQETVFVSGKGGVGKSTITGAIANGFEGSGEVIVIDTDKAHSMLDTFGFSPEDIDKFTSKSDIIQVSRKKIQVLLTHDIIPEVPRDNEKHTELNRLLDRLIKDEGLLPLLRMAVHPTFLGIPLPYQDFARVIQIIELIKNHAYYKIDTSKQGSETLDYSLLESPANKVLIDSENTQGLLRIINSLHKLQNSIKNMKSRKSGSIFNPANASFKAMLKYQPNLARVAESSLVENADHYGEVLRISQQYLVDETQMAIVLVTQPGWNDLNQTIREIESLKKQGVLPAAVVLNKCNLFPKETAEYIEAYKAIDENIVLIPIRTEFEQINPTGSDEERASITEKNLEGVGEDLGFFF